MHSSGDRRSVTVHDTRVNVKSQSAGPVPASAPCPKLLHRGSGDDAHDRSKAIGGRCTPPSADSPVRGRYTVRLPQQRRLTSRRQPCGWIAAALVLGLGLETVALGLVTEVQRAALVELYNATGGPSWLLRAGWADSVPSDPCQDSWTGVTCNASDVVYVVRRGRVVGAGE